jgi:GNAT superfamily N-acetyltransferase
MTTKVELTLIDALNQSLRPLGLSARMFRGEEDLQANVDLNNACARADGEEYVDTIEQARVWMANTENGDPRTDMAMVEGPQGALVAKALTWWWKNDAGEWNYGVNGWVHPGWRRQGIGGALLRWTEGRAREIAATHTRGDAPAYLACWTQDKLTDKVDLLTGAGYEAIRHGYTMLRNLSDPILDVPLPQGIEVRPVQEAHIRPIWEAMREAFRDHWGYTEWTEHDYQQFREWPDSDPALWRIAWDGDQVIGGCLNEVLHRENEALGLSRGWMALIAIRRPWRKQGVAKATIERSLRMFKDLGLAEAGLGVDAQNPTGALQLYEGQGFRVHKSGTNYRKTMIT